MYTILLSILFGALVGASLRCADVMSTVWAVVLGLLAAVAAFALASRLLGRRLAKRMVALQSGMEATQKRLQAKIKSFEFRPVGSPQQMMREIGVCRQRIADAVKSLKDQGAFIVGTEERRRGTYTFYVCYYEFPKPS